MKPFLSCTKWSKSKSAFLLLLASIVLVYSNTFHAEWHFDDRHSIVENSKVQISEFTLKSLSQAIEHPDQQRIWRPLAYLSFSMNWYVGQDEVFGFHVINILIHCVTSFILFQVLSCLFQSPVLKQRYSDEWYTISLLAAILWAVNPIQTQAVTYIVQRMTLLAALFYISGIFFYLRARSSEQMPYRFLYFILCAVAWLLALASKENAILLPLGLVLVEIVFFQRISEYRVRKRYPILFLAVSIIICIIGCVIYLNAQPLSLFAGYNDRFFTPWERVITQPRVVLFYLTQIFYPHPARLSIEHDFVISTSLIQPWTTLPAIIVVFALVVGALMRAERWPLLCFSILFFFLNHSIEASFVPLEIVFEHRNYLPSMFIFAPVAAGITWLMKSSMKKRPGLYWVLSGLSICLIIGFGVGTYQRNRVWRTESSLWADAYHKAPSMHRPVHNLAMALYERNGRLQEALRLYYKADDLTMHRRSHRAWLYSNIANIHYRTGRFELAKEYYLKANTIAPKKDLIRFRLAETLVQQKKFSAALNHVEALIERNPQNSEYLNLKGNILLQRMMPQRALAIFRANLRFNPHQASAYVNVGRALSAMGRYDQAEKLIKMGNSLDQENLKFYIRLLDIYLKRGDNNSAGDLSRFLVDSAAANDIRLTVEELAEEPYVTADDVNNMLNAIALELQNRLINAHHWTQ